jgi:hypothetical protein
MIWSGYDDRIQILFLENPTKVSRHELWALETLSLHVCDSLGALGIVNITKSHTPDILDAEKVPQIATAHPATSYQGNPYPVVCAHDLGIKPDRETGTQPAGTDGTRETRRRFEEVTPTW